MFVFGSLFLGKLGNNGKNKNKTKHTIVCRSCFVTITPPPTPLHEKHASAMKIVLENLTVETRLYYIFLFCNRVL